MTKLMNEQGEAVDTELQKDLVQIMKVNTKKIRQTYNEDTFSRLLWDEQLKATSAKDHRQIKWYPILIKWCLNLKLLSGAAYHAQVAFSSCHQRELFGIIYTFSQINQVFRRKFTNNCLRKPIPLLCLNQEGTIHSSLMK